MKVFVLCLVIWFSVLSLACYFLGITLVYFILLGVLFKIISDEELIPWGGKKVIPPQPRPQFTVFEEERKTA